MTEYNDLLKQLQSDEPFRPEPPKKPTHRAYELESRALKRESYEAADLEGFLGFIVSIMVSTIMHTSTPLAAAIVKDDFLEKKFDDYETKTVQAGHAVTEGAGELAQALAGLCTAAIDQIVEDPEAKVGVRDSFEIVQFSGALSTLFMLGRAFEAANEDDRPDPVNVLLGAVQAYFKRIPNLDTLEDVSEGLQKAIKLQLGTLEGMDMANIVKDPEEWIKNRKSEDND